MQIAWKVGVVALIALALTTLPGGGAALDVVLMLLSVLFLAAIAALGYRFYRQYHFDLDALQPTARLTLYCSIALAVLTVIGTSRLFDLGGGAGIIVWFALLALCSYGLYWVWTQYRSYG